MVNRDPKFTNFVEVGDSPQIIMLKLLRPSFYTVANFYFLLIYLLRNVEIIIYLFQIIPRLMSLKLMKYWNSHPRLIFTDGNK